MRSRLPLKTAQLLSLLCSFMLGAPLSSLAQPVTSPQEGKAQANQAQANQAQEGSSELTSKVMWRFEGPLAPRLEGLVLELYASRVEGHLFETGALLEHFKAALAHQDDPLSAAELACLREGCDESALLMRRFKLKERIFVSAEEGPEGFVVTAERLTHNAQGVSKPKRYVTKGSDLTKAASQLFEQLLQVGSLKVEGLPKRFSLEVDGEPLAVSAWPIALEAGEHALRFSAPDHEPHELKLEVKPSQLTELKLTLTSSLVDFKVLVLDDEHMSDLEVRLDGELIKPGALQKLRIKRDYKVTLSATDRVSHEETIRLEPNDKVAVLTVELPYSRAPWKVALKRPHPDRVHNSGLYVRASRGQVNAGDWRGVVSGREGAPKELSSQAYALSTWGIDAGFSWDLDPSATTGSLRLDLAGVSYQQVSGPVTLKEGAPGVQRCGDAFCKAYELESLSRTLTRLLWVGYQATMWRVTPYAQGGLMWLYERGELSGGGVVSAHSLRLGWEVGVDALISPELTLKAALSTDAWPNSRGAYQLALGVSYTFTTSHPF